MIAESSIEVVFDVVLEKRATDRDLRWRCVHSFT